MCRYYTQKHILTKKAHYILFKIKAAIHFNEGGKLFLFKIKTQ